MPKKASGEEFLEQAKQALAAAKTIHELRRAQAVLLPLQGLSLKETAQALGISVSWASHLRIEFIRRGCVPDENPPKQGGRRRENMSQDEEATFLTPFVDKAAAGGILVVTEIRQALEAYLGRKVALASVYNLLHRHGWRKLAPDKRHHKADVEAQDNWKKNSQISSRRSAGNGREKAKPGY